MTLDLLRVDLTSLNRTKDFFENRLLTLGDWVGMAVPQRRFYGGTYRIFIPKEKQQEQRQQNKQTENYGLIED